MIMWASPIGAFGAIAAVVGETGWSALAALEEQVMVQGYLEGTVLPEVAEATRAGTFRSSASEISARAAALREQVQRWTSAAEPDLTDDTE